jgi:hypothetical protein
MRDREGRPGTPVPVPPARRNGAMTCLVWVLGAALGCVVLLFVLAAWSLHERSEPPPAPDVRAEAHSAAGRSADRSAAATIDARIGALRSRLPWLKPAGRSTTDQCAVTAEESGFGKPQWVRGGCVREVVAYFGFDGPAGRRQTQLRAALIALGWLASPTGSLTGSPADSPTAPPDPDLADPVRRFAASFDLWDGPVFATPASGVRWTGEVVADERPDVPSLRLGAADIDLGSGPPASPPGNSEFHRSATLEWRPLTAARAARTVYRAHRYLLALHLDADYSSAALPGPSQVPAGPATPYYSPCLSGSGTCN